MRLIPIRPKGRATSDQIIGALTQAVQETQVSGLRLMQTYPPAPATQEYVRTGTLRRSWHLPPVRVSPGRIEGEIASSGGIAPYNAQVQGEPGDQWAFFAGRGWQGVEKLRQLVERELPLRAQRAIDRLFGKG